MNITNRVTMSKNIIMENEKEVSLNSLKNNNVINVSWPERMVSSTAGALLISSGIRNILHHPVSSFFKTAIGAYLVYRGASGNCALYNAIGTKQMIERPEPIVATAKMVINRPKDEVYMFWRRLENLPIFMEHLSDVIEEDSVHSYWEAFLPGKIGKIHWNAQVIRDDFGEVISWQSIGSSQLENAGKVTFKAIDENQCELEVIIVYRAPAGDIGKTLAKWFNGGFQNMIQNDILRFKDYMEGRLISHEALEE